MMIIGIKQIYKTRWTLKYELWLRISPRTINTVITINILTRSRGVSISENRSQQTRPRGIMLQVQHKVFQGIVVKTAKFFHLCLLVVFVFFFSLWSVKLLIYWTWFCKIIVEDSFKVILILFNFSTSKLSLITCIVINCQVPICAD